MIGFDGPPFLIERRDPVVGEGGIAGHQILHANAVILVYEDVLDQQEREVHAFKVDFQGGVQFEFQRVH